MNEKEILEYDETARRICAKFQEIRESQELSKNVVSEKSGLSRSAIMRIEKGERVPSLNTLLRLAKALDVRLSEVIQPFEN